jgi:predicted site-specific integrase-resolvase
MLPKTYTQREVADALKVSETTVRRERKAGKLKALMVRVKPVYTEEHIIQYMREVCK